jgi:hypothetical protein
MVVLLLIAIHAKLVPKPVSMFGTDSPPMSAWALRDFPEARLIPGAPAEVAIQTGTRTALEYFLEPIRDIVRNGMRER